MESSEERALGREPPRPKRMVLDIRSFPEELPQDPLVYGHSPHRIHSLWQSGRNLDSVF